MSAPRIYLDRFPSFYKKNYQYWWKFDEVLTKTNLLSFFGMVNLTQSIKTDPLKSQGLSYWSCVIFVYLYIESHILELCICQLKLVTVIGTVLLQLESFRQLHLCSHESASTADTSTRLVNNFRPPQPLNDRSISVSFRKFFAWSDYVLHRFQIDVSVADWPFVSRFFDC